MQFLIKTLQDARPYLSSLPFVAHDFRQWGHSVESYPDDSKYITEVRYREQRQKLASSRATLMEVWIQEVIARQHQPPTNPTPSLEDIRLERVSGMVQDYFRAIAKIGILERPKRITRWSAKCLRIKYTSQPVDSGLGLVVRYMRCLYAIRHISEAPLPSDSHTDIIRADQIILEFWPNEVKMRHLTDALCQAMYRPKRLGNRPETDTTTGIIKVQMWADVGDCVVLERREDEELVEPPPRYGRDEEPPAYVEE